MDNEQIKNLIREVIREQGGVVPFHIHNGIDSPFISAVNPQSVLGTLIEHNSVTGVGGVSIGISPTSDSSIYRLLMTGVFTTSETELQLTFNSDSGANYYYALHRFGLVADADNHSAPTSGGLANNREAFIPLYDGETTSFLADLIFTVNTGVTRKVQGILSTFDDGDTWFSSDVFGAWNNTSSAVTSVDITGGQNFIDGTEYWLYSLT